MIHQYNTEIDESRSISIHGARSVQQPSLLRAGWPSHLTLSPELKLCGPSAILILLLQQSGGIGDHVGPIGGACDEVYKLFFSEPRSTVRQDLPTPQPHQPGPHTHKTKETFWTASPRPQPPIPSLSLPSLLPPLGTEPSAKPTHTPSWL